MIYLATFGGRTLLFRWMMCPWWRARLAGHRVRLDNDDYCLGGIIVSEPDDTLILETSGGKTLEFRKGRVQPTSREARAWRW